MPLPTPTKGEKRNDFISRCISFAVDEGMPQNQAVAACHTSWRRAKGIKEPTRQSLKFNYQVPIIESAFINDDFIIQGTALNATITSNNHKFIEEELQKSANTLSGVPLLIDHRNEVDAIKGRVISGEYNEDERKVNFRAHVIDHNIKEMIKDGRIDSVSVGADVKELEETDDGFFIPHGIKFRELSLVAVPADEGATFTVALQEAYEMAMNEPVLDLEEKQVTGMEAERNKRGMSVSDFYAIPRDPPSASALPIFDAAHVRNAMARFNQTSMSSAERKTARAKILRAAKKFKIDTEGFEKATESDNLIIINKSGGKIMESEDKTEEETKPEEEKEEPKDEVTEEKLQKMITNAVEKAVEKAVKSADEDEKPEEPEKEEEPEEPEEEPEEPEEEESTEEKGKYKIVQGHGALKGGSFTLVRA